MPGITAKKLNSIRKSLEAVFSDDETTLGQITKSMDGLAAAIEKGESVTMDDVSDILGEVVVDKAVDDGGRTPDTSGEDDPIDPLAPLFKGLYDALFDKGQIRKGLNETDAQKIFDEVYQKALGELDGAIEAAAEAAAIELGHGNRVAFGKATKQEDRVGRGKRGGSDTADDGDDDDMDDMEKLLKGLGATPALVKKIGSLQGQVDMLQTERDLERFSKTASEIGEPEAFGAELLKLHKLDPKLADSIQKRLQTKNAALRKSRQWSAEIGAGGGQNADGSAYDQLVAKGNELVEKGAKDVHGRPLSFAKAFTEACNRNPDLYSEYQDEQRRKARA